MKRRGGADAPVSFFSFQDVLLSLIGITIVITVILFLQITRTVAKTAVEVADRDREAESAAETMERESLAERVRTLEAAIRAAQKRPDVDPLARRTSLRAELLAAAGELQGLERQSEELSRQLRELTLLSPDALELRESMELMARRDELVTELGATERRRRISYIVDTAQVVTPVLLEISADKVVYSQLAADAVPFRIPAGTSAARMRQALDYYLRAARQGRTYLLVILKPSGIPSFWQLYDFIQALPQESRPVIGLDLIPEDSHISELFPSSDGERN